MAQVTRPLMNYYGGKWNIAEWVISHFPNHGTYVEVFGGALSVFMKKQPSKLEVVNDLDARIVNLYRAIRNQESARHLQLLLDLTPYSRNEYRFCQEESLSTLEDARRIICASFMGVGSSILDKTTGFRNSKSSNTSPPDSFRNYVEAFQMFHERMKRVMIEQLDWSEMIAKYDSPETLFYFDPPYIHETRHETKRGYAFEMTNDDHEKLVVALNSLKGKAILSGYDHEIYGGLSYWHKVTKEARVQQDGTKVECLWLCPKTHQEQKQMSFF